MQFEKFINLGTLIFNNLNFKREVNRINKTMLNILKKNTLLINIIIVIIIEEMIMIMIMIIIIEI